MPKKKIIRKIALILLIAMMSLSCFGCSKERPTPPADAPSTLLAFEGEYDREKHIEAINTYIETCNPQVITIGNDIVIPINEGAKGADIAIIADASGDYPESELNILIDLDIDYRIDTNSNEVIIETDWWYEDSSWVRVEDLWSFTVSVGYEGGKTEWYYLRVDFIADVESR